MRIGPDTSFWVVLDPATDTQGVVSILAERSVQNLGAFLSGQVATEHRRPTIYTDEAEAKRDAKERYGAWLAYRQALRDNEARAEGALP